MRFNALRLGIARKRRMLNKKALATRLKLAADTIIRWEGDKTVPPPDYVRALAIELMFPEEFFYGPDIYVAEKSTTSFRSQKAMSAAYRDAALAAGSLGFLISDWIESRFELPKETIPDLHGSSPEDAALELRQEWGLGERPVSNMIHLLESKGVRVFSLAENTATVNAYSLWRQETPFVFLNTFKSAESSRFDAAHELAHLVLHQDGKVVGREAEDQANRFASAFLMPKGDVLAQIPVVNSVGQMISAKRRWKVSLVALNYRLHRLGLTSEWKNRDFCIEMVTRGYNKSEPDGIPRECSKLWEMVLKELWSEGVTHHNIATDLALPEDELATLLFGILQSPDASIRDLSPQPSLVLVGDVGRS